MLKGSVLVLLLAAAAPVAPYPRYEQVIRSPKEFDLLYSSSSAVYNETWYFNAAVNLTSIFIPSQIFNFWSSGPWTSGTYKEAVDVSVYETTLSSVSANVQTRLVATGSFNGTAGFGQELRIPLQNVTQDGPPAIQRYVNYNSGCKYTISLAFMTTGIYPWYTTRLLSTYAAIHASTNVAGIVIGTAYSL